MVIMEKVIGSVPFHSRGQFKSTIEELVRHKYKILLIEIRWDYYTREITPNLTLWANNYIHGLGMKTIFTYQNSNLSQDIQIPILLNLISSKPDYIDLDVDLNASRLTELAEYAIENEVAIVFSYHNREETPSLQIISDMYEFFIQMLPKLTSRQENILKMVFTAKTSNDVCTILEFCRKYADHGFSLITFCMGEIGKESRIRSILSGAAYTYAYIRESTAPGQVHVSEIQERLIEASKS